MPDSSVRSVSPAPADPPPHRSPSSHGSRGVLLINLGTPEAPEPGAIRRYLREFLSDGRVLDMHPVLRKLLLETMILPRRPRAVAHAYSQVWTDGGSPLLVHTLDLARDLEAQWEDGTRVVVAMRYGKPSISEVLAQLATEVDRIDVVPLYPHATASTTGTAVAEVHRVLSELWQPPPVRVIEPWFDHPAFLSALSSMYRDSLADFDPDHLLFSYHGIPVRHLERSVPGHLCDGERRCCERPEAAHGGCYRAQCVQTSIGLAGGLGLPEGAWTTAFQSRFGRDPWILPEAEATIRELVESGVRRLAVACPGFAADCLETIEEIGIRAREVFLESGGEDFLLLPCANSHPAWVEALADLVGPDEAGTPAGHRREAGSPARHRSEAGSTPGFSGR